MPSREALLNFSKLVGAHYAFDPSLVPRLQVEITRFWTKDMEGALSLANGGYRQNTDEDHIEKYK